MALTQDLGRLVAEVLFARLPQEAVNIARTGFIDCIATFDRLRHLEDLSARELTAV
jgi:hypothetical protein